MSAITGTSGTIATPGSAQRRRSFNSQSHVDNNEDGKYNSPETSTDDTVQLIKHLQVHADNFVGQNKINQNNAMLGWLILVVVSVTQPRS
jgi:hypothetical protein